MPLLIAPVLNDTMPSRWMLAMRVAPGVDRLPDGAFGRVGQLHEREVLCRRLSIRQHAFGLQIELLHLGGQNFAVGEVDLDVGRVFGNHGDVGEDQAIR